MATHSTKCTKLPEWVIPIQVGSALSNKVFEDTLDFCPDILFLDVKLIGEK